MNRSGHDLREYGSLLWPVLSGSVDAPTNDFEFILSIWGATRAWVKF